jgi:hypothetical protein
MSRSLWRLLLLLLLTDLHLRLSVRCEKIRMFPPQSLLVPRRLYTQLHPLSSMLMIDLQVDRQGEPDLIMWRLRLCWLTMTLLRPYAPGLPVHIQVDIHAHPHIIHRLTPLSPAVEPKEPCVPDRPSDVHIAILDHRVHVVVVAAVDAIIDFGTSGLRTGRSTQHRSQSRLSCR